jgi:hypothetical protein
MAGESNYKQKYMERRAKYMNAVDVAFRLGFEEGSKQSQVDQANQQMQDANAKEQAMAGAQPGAPGAEGGKPNNNGAAGTPDQGTSPDKSGAPSVQPNPIEPVPQASPTGAPMKESENPEGSELDQYIAKLESMLNKGEAQPEDMKKSLEEIKNFSAQLKKAAADRKMYAELAKSAAVIPEIAKALHKPAFKFGVQAAHNLNTTAKSAVTMHHKIVNDIMEKWEKEESKAGKDILSALSVEGVTKD